MPERRKPDPAERPKGAADEPAADPQPEAAETSTPETDHIKQEGEPLGANFA